MKPLINIDTFRKYYEDVIACKESITANADNLSDSEEKRLDAILNIEDRYGREMVKKVIANAVRQDSQNYSKQVRNWADNAVIAMFIYETDNVLSEYIPDHLSEAAIEAIAKNLIEKEKKCEFVKSKEGTEYEVEKDNEYCTLLCYHDNDIPMYAVSHDNLNYIRSFSFSDKDFNNAFFDFAKADKYFHMITAEYKQTDEAKDVLLNQYLDFKSEILQLSPEEIFEKAYRIAAVEDVYFHLTENAILSDEQEKYIINSGHNTLMDFADSWYESENTTDQLQDSIDSSFEQELAEYNGSELEDNSEEEME